MLGKPIFSAMMVSGSVVNWIKWRAACTRMVLNRTHTKRDGYVSAEAILTNIDKYIVPPGLGDNAGLCGALALGLKALKTSNE